MPRSSSVCLSLPGAWNHVLSLCGTCPIWDLRALVFATFASAISVFFPGVKIWSEDWHVNFAASPAIESIVVRLCWFLFHAFVRHLRCFIL